MQNEPSCALIICLILQHFFTAITNTLIIYLTSLIAYMSWQTDCIAYIIVYYSVKKVVMEYPVF